MIFTINRTLLKVIDINFLKTLIIFKRNGGSNRYSYHWLTVQVDVNNTCSFTDTSLKHFLSIFNGKKIAKWKYNTKITMRMHYIYDIVPIQP